jgi:hypothetical protein
MATFGAFINLRQDDPEAGRRRSILQSVLVGHQPKYVHGEAQYKKYSDLADQLANTGALPDILFASCWPGMDALRNNTPKGIIFTGLTDAPGDGGYGGRITGIKAFAVTRLCRNWLPLLMQITSGITRVAVIYDQALAHKSMVSQYAEIDKFKAPFSSLTQIYTADPNYDADPNSTQSLNPNIESEIAAFAQDDSPAGLIVTAGTRTMGLRDRIIKAVNAANRTTPKLFAIYPASLFVDADRGGLMSYGPDLSKLYQQAAQCLKLMIDSNVPPEQFQTRFPIIVNQDFELVVSRSLANGLNLKIPSTFTVTLDGTSQQIEPTIVA